MVWSPQKLEGVGRTPWTKEAAGFGLQRVPDTPGRMESPGASCADSKPSLKWPRAAMAFLQTEHNWQKAKDRRKVEKTVGLSSEVSGFSLSFCSPVLSHCLHLK